MGSREKDLVARLLEEARRAHVACKKDRRRLNLEEGEAGDGALPILLWAEVAMDAVSALGLNLLSRHFDYPTGPIAILREYDLCGNPWMWSFVLERQSDFPDFVSYLYAIEHTRMALLTILESHAVPIKKEKSGRHS